MFRTLSLLALCATVAASKDGFAFKGETTSMLQVKVPKRDSEFAQLRVNATAADEAADNATANWSFHDIDFGDLLSSFDPQKLKDKINGILDDHDLSLDDLSSKLANFTTQFQDRMNETVTQTQGQLQSMKEQLETKGKAVKNRMLLETADKVTKLGDAAVNVATKVTAKVGDARVRVQTMVMSLENEKLTEEKDAIRKSLDAAVNTLSTFVHSLLQAVHFRQPTSLLTVNDDPDLFDRSITKAKEVLKQSDDALASAEVYVAFVNRTIQDTKANAEALLEKLSKQADDAIDSGDLLAQKLIDELGEVNDVLGGKFSYDEVVELNERSSAPRAASVWLGAAVLLAVFLS